MSASAKRGEIVVLGDAHLGESDSEIVAFCEFLAELPGRAEILVLLGDIFSLWLGVPRLTLPHHRRVLDVCAEIREQGVRVLFVEGNREFGAGRWAGSSFDEASEGYIRVPWAGRRWLFAHGDLLDVSDRGTKLFRRLARSWPVQRLVSLLPVGVALAFAGSVESRLHDRNLPRKTSLPPERFKSFASWVAQQDCELSAIGHVHVEMKHVFSDLRGKERTVFVLPDWRTSRRYLRIDRSGDASFVSWRSAPRPGPSVIRVAESEGRVEIDLERDDGFEPGMPVSVRSGHGDPPRRGAVVSVSPRLEDSPHAEIRLELELEAGVPVRVGDRVTLDTASRGGKA